MRRLKGFILVLFLCGGCASLNYYSKLNPDCAGLQYQRILIQFVDPEPGYAQFGEKAAKEEITEQYGGTLQCYAVSDAIYAGLRTRAEIEADVRKFILDKRIDAILRCVSGQAVKKQTNVIYNPAVGTTYANNDQKNAGYRMELFDIRTNKSVWFSTAHSEANSFFNSFQGMMKGFIQKSVADMKENNILGPDNRPDLLPPPSAPEKPKEEI